MSDAAASGTLQSIVPVFLVDDIAATIQWCKRSLGFEGEAVPASPPHTSPSCRGMTWSSFCSNRRGTRGPNCTISERVASWNAYVRIRGVHALFETLRGLADVAIVQPLCRQPYGETEFGIRDPNGYVLVFAERL